MTITKGVELLKSATRLGERNLQMPGDGRYQPDALKPYLGYDQWAGLLVLVEWEWLETLAEKGVIPRKDAVLLDRIVLRAILERVTTTKQDKLEKTTKHDIIALRTLMAEHLPEPLRPWLHFCATSYDIISTAYALQARLAFEEAFQPLLLQLDVLWREKIERLSYDVQAGRTHLQTALPVTVGFWLAQLHSRFLESAENLGKLARNIPGKFSGAVGTSASQRAFMPDNLDLEERLMERLGITVAMMSTQITPPEPLARFYYELLLLSGVLANLGEDVRILQSSQFGELGSESSTSSAMSHKDANPILAEQLAGMHSTVIAENMRIQLTLVSDLQRDLRNSSVMRGYSSVMVYTYQMLLTTVRLLKGLTTNEERCRENFEHSSKLVVAEALHLWLQLEGVEEAHELVNQKVIPEAKKSGKPLHQALAEIRDEDDRPLIPEEMLDRLFMSHLVELFEHPDRYIGDAGEISMRESQRVLSF